MVNTIFATKQGMAQAWLKSGKRVAVTKCLVSANSVVGLQQVDITRHTNKSTTMTVLEIGYGQKKLKNMAKPLKDKLSKGGFSAGVSQIQGIRVASENQEIKIGDSLMVSDVLAVGDVVKVQGTTKGRGFAGAIKRYGFHGGPATHGQSDRARAVGSIGSGTTPGRVWRGKRMPGHYGVDATTVSGLVVLHIDEVLGEVWLSGPVPGAVTSTLKITKTGETKKTQLDFTASGVVIPEKIVEEIKVKTEVDPKVAEPETEIETEKVVVAEEIVTKPTISEPSAVEIAKTMPETATITPDKNS